MSTAAGTLALSKMFAVFASTKGSYTKYQVQKRVACFECVAVLHEAKGAGPAPRAAQISRKTPEKVLLICHDHAELWKALDGIKLKGGIHP